VGCPKTTDYRRHFWWVAAAVVCLNALAWLLSDVYILSSFRELETERVREHVMRARNVIQQEAEYLRRMVVDEAFWDQTYQSAVGADRDGFARNISEGTFVDGRLSAIILADKDGQVVYGQGYHLDDRKPAAVNPELLWTLPALQEILLKQHSVRSIEGLLFVEPYPLMVAAAQVLKSDGSGSASGMLLYAREFNPNKIERLGDVLRLDIRLDDKPLDGEVLGSVVVHRYEDEVTGRVLLPDLLGHPGGVLDVMLDRELYRRGRRSIGYFLAWTLASSLLFGWLAFVLLNRMARASQRETEHYRLLFNGSPIPMWVYDAATLRFIDVNQAAVEQYGYSHQQFLHRTILDLRPPEDAELVREGVDRLLREQNPGAFSSRPVGTWTHMRQDGSRLLADVCVALFELQGRPAVLASAFDITDEVAKEQALSLSEERYRELFNHSPLPMWVVDMETLRYLDVNQTAVEKYGYSREEFLSMTIMDVRPAEEIQRLQDALPSARNGRGVQGVWHHRCKDGRILEVEIVLRDIPFEGHDARLVMANDVTEKERLRAEAEQVSRLAALGELSAGIAHEINNPNGMIQINLQLVADIWRDLQPVVQQQLAADPEWRLGGLPASRLQVDLPEILDEMHKGTQRVRDIVEDLKDFARHDEQASDERVDINLVVEAAERMVGNQVKKSGAAYRCELGTDLPQVSGTFRQLEQVVINLLINACQALSESGQLLVVRTAFDSAAGEVVVEVRDGGRGIEEKYLSRITEPFFTTRREDGGTGLGLSVSSRIVRDHGGKLRFYSRPGEGTRVELRLPVAREETA